MLKVALIQYDIEWEGTSANLKYLDRCLMNVEDDVDLAILPEMFHCGFSMNPTDQAHENGGEVLEWMIGCSIRYGFVIMGSVIVLENSQYYNRMFVVDGDDVQQYDKRHLFTMGGEHEVYAKGKDRLVVNVKGWRICPLICYDLRFPVWSRNSDEYDLLIYVANWPAPRKNVWNILLKARAIENQCYVIGVNRIGTDTINEYAGESQVINERGEELTNLNGNEGVAYVSLNMEELQKFRKRFPVLDDRDKFCVFE